MLNPKQQLFVAEYLKDLNATQAAIRAGYSEKTAHVQGPRLLENADIRAAVDVALATRVEEVKVDANWVLKRLVDEAEADVADLYDDDGHLKPVHEWPLIWRQGLVTGVDVEELFEGRGDDRRPVGVVKHARFSDRIRRIELIGKHVQVNAFAEQVHVTTDNLGDRLERAKKRLSGEVEK